MQEKIEKIIDSHFGMTDSMDQDVANAAAEIAKLLREDVVWEYDLKLKMQGNLAVLFYDDETWGADINPDEGFDEQALRQLQGQVVRVTVRREK